MDSIIRFFLKFTGRTYTPLQKIISMGPGILIFLVISPLVIFLSSRYLTQFINIQIPRQAELIIMGITLLISIPLMTWALLELWIKGKGTPAPITPTCLLVTSGPYSLCRNPIELGTNIYFMALGIFFDSLMTGVLCMLFGFALGISYIKFIEEKEMLIRFGPSYKKYLQKTPFMSLIPRLKQNTPEL